MSIFSLVSVILVLVALFAYLNLKVFKLPTTIGVMIIALVFSTSLIALHSFGFNYDVMAKDILSKINFQQTLMNGMLSFLLFAGAMHVNLNDLKKQIVPISLLATVGVLLSTFFIGYLTFMIITPLNPSIQFIHCLLFGALISPTDPIAVISLLKEAKAPKSLETKIAGESLFNDGVGVVIFIVILQLITSNADLSLVNISTLFFQEAVGGAAFGLAIGLIGFVALKSIDNYKVEVIITLALVTGGYSLAHYLHLSGPIAMVIAGLLIGNQGRKHAMSETTEEYLGLFWELVDEILNLSLFVLVGLEIIVISYNLDIFYYSLAIIPAVLLGRFLGVLFPITIMRKFRTFTRGVVPVMTWGGLRGGISIALALSMPDMPGRNIFIGITYSVVVFSVIVQGLSFKRVLTYFVSETK
jgi:CPA1 family monovalent cation:H+ antiporter